MHVGDSLHHDIEGANRAGIDSIFVSSTGGVHGEELGLQMGEAPTASGLQRLSVTHGAAPTHALPMFVWCSVLL